MTMIRATGSVGAHRDSDCAVRDFDHLIIDDWSSEIESIIAIVVMDMDWSPWWRLTHFEFEKS